MNVDHQAIGVGKQLRGIFFGAIGIQNQPDDIIAELRGAHALQ